MSDKYGTLYYVANENTLCYRQSHWTGLGYVMYGVLAGLLLRGGHNHLDGPFPFNPAWDKLRPATLADFEIYRVVPPPLG